MAVKVVDTSALAALAFIEPDGDAIVQALQGHELHAPTLMRYEIANVARTRIRRRPDSQAEIKAQLADLARLDITLHDLDVRALLDTAIAADLTAYDAAYLWLARALGAELVTLDDRLARAAQP
jgi:predicted nucleic acid-binding protein